MLEVLLSISSMLLSGVSIVFLKMGLDVQAANELKNPLSNALHLFKNKWWFTGGVFMLSGWLLRFILLKYADITFVRMIYVSHLIVVVFGSKFLMKEKFGFSFIISLAIILSGLLFVAISPPLTGAEIGSIQLYTGFFIVMLVIIICAILVSFLSKSTRKLFYAISSGTTFGLGAVTQAVFAKNNLEFSSLLNPAFYLSMIIQPLIYIMVIFSLIGFILGNMMAYRFKMSLSYTISYPLSEIVVLIGAIIIFSDDLSIITNPFRVIGIMLLMIGMVITLVTQRKHFVNPMLTVINE